jgi:hypothetical protein
VNRYSSNAFNWTGTLGYVDLNKSPLRIDTRNYPDYVVVVSSVTKTEKVFHRTAVSGGVGFYRNVSDNVAYDLEFHPKAS